MRGLRLTDCLPLAAIYGGYSLAGWVGRRLRGPLWDATLEGWDRRLFGVDPGIWLREALPRPALDLLECFYFSYYLLVVLGPWLMWARHGRRALWELWSAAGLAYLVCDLLFPWFPSTPPRVRWPEFAARGGARVWNRWILDRFSIGANVFPSSHAAAGAAFAVAHRRWDRRWGWLFACWGVGIAVSTVSGGYHYGVDAAGGLAVGWAAGRAGSWLHRRFHPGEAAG